MFIEIIKMSPKKIIKEIMTDPLHWLGWIITTGAIIGLFHLLGVHSLHTPWWNIGVLFATIVGIDIIKHITKLQ